MTDGRDPALAPAARCGQGRIDGACWRPGDPVKHLGPPEHLGIRFWSRLFATRCGLGPRYDDGSPMGWQPLAHDGFTEDDDYWCPPCVAQAGISYELYDDEPEGGGSGSGQ